MPYRAVSWILLAIGFVAFLFWMAIRRSNELFCVAVHQGEVRVLRGRAPPRLIRDFEDVLIRAKTDTAEVRVVVEQQQARVLSTGIDAGTEQQLRNVLGTWQLAQLRKQQ